MLGKALFSCTYAYHLPSPFSVYHPFQSKFCTAKYSTANHIKNVIKSINSETEYYFLRNVEIKKKPLQNSSTKRKGEKTTKYFPHA